MKLLMHYNMSEPTRLQYANSGQIHLRMQLCYRRGEKCSCSFIFTVSDNKIQITNNNKKKVSQIQLEMLILM